MENASKALIIAGAVLLSILIIGIGIAIFNSVSAPADEASAQMDSTAIEMYNQKFEKYVGTQNGSNVKALISSVISNNNANGTDRQITVNASVTATDLSTLQSSIQAASRYDVTITAYDNNSNRLVSLITITGPGI